MQEIEKEIEKILKYQGTLYYKNHHEVIICGRCSGIGTYIDDNVTNRVSCQQCKGDGRLVKKTTTVTFNDYMSTTLVPYIDEPVPYNNEIETFRIKIDKREYYYEKKYPELAELTYKKYDKKLKEIKIQEALENYHGKKR